MPLPSSIRPFHSASAATGRYFYISCGCRCREVQFTCEFLLPECSELKWYSIWSNFIYWVMVWKWHCIYSIFVWLKEISFLRLTTLVRPCYTTFSIGALNNYPNWCLMLELMMKIIPIGSCYERLGVLTEKGCRSFTYHHHEQQIMHGWNYCYCCN